MSQFTASQSESNAVAPCPRCQKPLFDPAGLGWCKACGYCRSVAESDNKVEQAPVKAAPNTVTATGAAIGQMPKWIWLTLLGVVFITGITFMISHKSRMPPFERALFTTVQIGVGIALMFIGQFIALIRIAPDEATLGFKDAVFPFRLYGLVIKHLPSTQITVYLGAWGLAAIISAAVLIGGVEHWLTYLPHNKNAQMKGTKK